MKPCIVYLAQNTAPDHQYGRDSRSLLVKSLDLFYKNYNNQFQQDILIFHEGDFSENDQEEVRAGRKEIHFHEVQFEVPDFLPRHEVPEIWTDGRKGSLSKYGMGHRHMIRFYGIQIFDILTDLGYDWMMRLDDDSFIHTPIEYDFFQFMKDNNYRYGYRVDMLESVQSASGYEELVEAFIKGEQISTGFLRKQHISKWREFKIMLEAVVMFGLEKTKLFPSKHFVTPLKSFPYWCYYNNFFISDLRFWKQNNVQSFIGLIDRLGGAYKYRWNDLIMQSTAVQLFMPKEQVFKFEDWTYEHATIKKDKLNWGGIYPGKNQNNLPVVKAFRKKYGRLHTPKNWSEA